MKKLPFSKKIIYALGQLGWATTINVINLQLVYFYLPPDDSGLPVFISQMVFLGILNIVTIALASGRLFDAITDPWIASISDNWKGKLGRRIPFMRVGAIPTALFMVLLFFPPVAGISTLNIVWLVVIQLLFYLSLTIYLTPFFALIPELGHTSDERLSLSTWISITYAMGILIGSLVPNIASLMESYFSLEEGIQGTQYAMIALGVFSAFFMLLPAFLIDERKYTKPQDSQVPMMKAIKRSFANPSFKYYVVAEFAYFMALAIIMAGMLYYVTILLRLDDGHVGSLMGMLVGVSFLFYPLVNIVAKRYGKKPFLVAAFLFMAMMFLGIYWLGNDGLDVMTQAYILVVGMAIPMSFLGVLPNAILSDIAKHDSNTSGINQEGMYFAARTLCQKFGQTFGIFIFAALTTIGNSIGDDLGIRLSALIGSGLCFLAGLYFMKYDEKSILDALEE